MILIWFFVFLSTVAVMEFMAWATHKYVMHGIGWYFHEDHHYPYVKPFQKNDFFFLIYAIPSWLLIMFGLMNQWPIMHAAGFGVLAYGIIYFLIHDVLIHRRFNWFDKVQWSYFKAIRKAHKVHHKNQGKEDGECFGLLVVPRKFFKR